MAVMVGTAFVLLMNLVLKHQDTVLAKVKTNISFKSPVVFRNAPVSETIELFPPQLVLMAVEKSWVLYDKPIRKAVAFDRCPSQPSSKRQQFSFSFSRSMMSDEQSELLSSSRTPVRKGAQPQRLLPLPANMGRERSFELSLYPS